MRATARSAPLRLLHMFHVEIVLIADELNQLFVRAEPPVDANRPRARVRLRVVDRDVDLHPPVGGTPDALGDLRAVRERRAVDVEPAVVPQADRLDDERVALVLADRV